MTTIIKIIQKDNDKCDYVKTIIELLNKCFTTQEAMNQRFELNCLEVAQELCGQLTFDQLRNTITFDFSQFIS